ncbi:hypothetical protein [Parasulfitobacter algicola]|uniref:Uncharacterized protein n=1 Tax=Parasulfitobacter algicola TaxID=2614809 RepID=A0ABX2IWD9_9RHOB|nr:hypothetical protein [Sulfitobacter algicola]NSX56351.1 hypothetical protein [Sulfitobacter algicola]
MFKFLFRKRGEEVEATIETQRDAFERVIDELNDLIGKQGNKPKITVDPASGHISLALPGQLQDEALSLPSPEDKEEMIVDDNIDENDPPSEGSDKAA